MGSNTNDKVFHIKQSFIFRTEKGLKRSKAQSTSSEEEEKNPPKKTVTAVSGGNNG